MTDTPDPWKELREAALNAAVFTHGGQHLTLLSGVHALPILALLAERDRLDAEVHELSPVSDMLEVQRKMFRKQEDKAHEATLRAEQADAALRKSEELREAMFIARAALAKEATDG